jgi:iron(III) transport system ATP-binding protein
LVTHDQIEAMAIADRIALLNRGLIEQEGSPIDLYREPSTLFAAEFMGNNNRLEGTLVENADKRAVIEAMGGCGWKVSPGPRQRLERRQPASSAWRR